MKTAGFDIFRGVRPNDGVRVSLSVLAVVEPCMSADIKFSGQSCEFFMATSLRSRTKVNPLAKDALDVGTIRSRTVLTSVGPGWVVIPPEDIFVKKKLKATVQNVINKAVEAILAGEELSQEDDDSNEEYNQNVSITESLPQRPEQSPLVERPIKPTTRRGCVRNMLFPIETYHLMQERGWFTELYDSYRLMYELDHNHLIVHMASPVHDAAANSWNDTITLWHMNGGNGAETLQQLGQGRINHFEIHSDISRISVDGWIGKVARPEFYSSRNIVTAGIHYPRYRRRSIPDYGDRGVQDP